MERISKDRYHLSNAEMAAQRSTCLRRHYGAIIVNNDEIVSSGYNGAPPRRNELLRLRLLRTRGQGRA